MRRASGAHNLARQALALDRHFPAGEVVLKPNRLHWTGDLQPTRDSRLYKVRITYRLGKHPQVKVLTPELDTGLARTLPHVFRYDNLCLYRDGEWATSMLLAETIVPWSSEWLLHYEIWKATGEWYGGGDWPPVDRSISPHMVAEQGSTVGPTPGTEQGSGVAVTYL
jgi:hypothetical protein